jgi:Cu(I)/Ag(I) efflux system membrane fusion protein
MSTSWTPRLRLLALTLLLLGSAGLLYAFRQPVLDWFFPGREKATAHEHGPARADAAGEISHYTCPMHPSVRQSGPGPCPICGMDLVAVSRGEAAGGELAIGADALRSIGVETDAIQRVPVTSEIRAVGRVAFDETRYEDVTVKFAGYIERLHVEETGRPVRRGQILFTLYSPELYAAQREYLTALASQRAARSTGAPDRADYLVDAARQKLRLWDLSEEQIRAVAEKGEPVRAIPVFSPASGYVMEKDVVQGGAVQPGMRLFRIAALDRVWVEAEVYESELPRVRTGQRAVVTLPYQPGVELRGRVSLVYPALSPETRTGRVRIEVPNRTGAGGPLLKPEMYADVVLQAPDREILAVPASAVLYTGPRRLVFLDLGEGRFRQQEVRLGAKVGDAFEVLAGLQEGDRVVTSGNFLIDAESRLRQGGNGHEQHAH